MSVWLFKAPLSDPPQTELALPFSGLPDLSGVTSEGAMRKLLALVDPAAPPETITRQAETHWRNFSGLAVGDLLVVPTGANFALAEIIKPYYYDVDAGADLHKAAVKWLESDIPARKLSGLSGLADNGAVLQPVPHADQRKQVYILLKRSYNRFAKWRWILCIVVVMQVITMLIGMTKR
jgi:hypothetical protein